MKTFITPWLSVQSSIKAVAFYKAAFNAVETYRLEDPDGNAVIKLSVNGAEFWVSDSSQNNAEKESICSNSIRMIINVDEPDTVFAQALEAGATEISSISEAHGWRTGRIIDVCGIDWEIAKELHTV